MKFKTVIWLPIIASVTFLFGCSEINTKDPIKAFTLWSSTTHIPDGVSVIHGQYYRSSHWTNEYYVYLELEAPVSWRKELIKRENLFEVTDANRPPDDAPNWFKPPINYKSFRSRNFSEGSAYYIDTLDNTVFIYESHL